MTEAEHWLTFRWIKWSCSSFWGTRGPSTGPNWVRFGMRLLENTPPRKRSMYRTRGRLARALDITGRLGMGCRAPCFRHTEGLELLHSSHPEKQKKVKSMRQKHQIVSLVYMSNRDSWQIRPPLLQPSRTLLTETVRVEWLRRTRLPVIHLWVFLLIFVRVICGVCGPEGTGGGVSDISHGGEWIGHWQLLLCVFGHCTDLIVIQLFCNIK